MILFNFFSTLRNNPSLEFFVVFFGNFYLSLWNWGITYFPSYIVRKIILSKLYGVKLGKNVNIHMGVKFFKPWGVIIGDNVNIQMGCFIDGRGLIEIGSNCDITIGVKILTQQHDIDDGYYTTQSKKEIIGDDCILGSYSLILPGVELGQGSVIGAGSVVPKSIGTWKMAAGNPAKEIRDRKRNVFYRVGFKRPFH